jgi:ABC-type phosphate/phosphonate transport system ATPase subunit
MTWQRANISRVTIHRATEMDVTVIGLQNAGKTSLLRVLAVKKSLPSSVSITVEPFELRAMVPNRANAC